MALDPHEKHAVVELLKRLRAIQNELAIDQLAVQNRPPARRRRSLIGELVLAEEGVETAIHALTRLTEAS
jgi:hypothetical protein